MHSLNDSISQDTQHVVLIDDDDSVRQGLELMLINLGYRVHSYGNAVDFLDTTHNLTPYIILCDMNMPLMSGIDVQVALAKKGCTSPIIFISGESSVNQSVTAMKQGALEFITKPFNLNELMKTVEKGFEIEKNAQQNALKQRELEAKLQKLSPREYEVFYLLVKGYNNTEILNTLNISLPTTKQYKSEVMRKLNLNSLSELIAMHQ
jgi:FixJ family two-component response regulator